MQRRWDGGKMNNTCWSLLPTLSVNGMEFGTNRSKVRSILGKPTRVFKKTSTSDNTTDVYVDFHVYYSADDKLNAIEFFGGDISLSIDSQILFPGTLSEAKKVLPDLEECYGSYISRSASIGIGVEGDTIVSVLVGCKGYYL